MKHSDSDKSELCDISTKTDLKDVERAELDVESTVPSTSLLTTSKDGTMSAKVQQLKKIPDSRRSLSSSLGSDEDETDFLPTLTTERLCSKNTALPNSTSAQGDICRLTRRIRKAKDKQENMTFNFPVPEFLREIPKYDREYEDHELEDASDLIPLLLSTEKIKISDLEKDAASKLAKLSLTGQKK